MSLLERLRAAHATIDPQFLPTANESAGFTAGLALYLEHGEAFLEAAERGGLAAVTDVITGAGQELVTPEESDERAAQAARQATAQQTRVEHETGAGETEKQADEPRPRGRPRKQ